MTYFSVDPGTRLRSSGNCCASWLVTISAGLQGQGGRGRKQAGERAGAGCGGSLWACGPSHSRCQQLEHCNYRCWLGVSAQPCAKPCPRRRDRGCCSPTHLHMRLVWWVSRAQRLPSASFATTRPVAGPGPAAAAIQHSVL